MNAANYMMSNNQKLLLIMFLDGENWRAHNQQIFHYQDGAWTMAMALSIEAWELFLAVEGMFLYLAEIVEKEEQQPPWKWESICSHVLDFLRDPAHNHLQILMDKTKQQSDHLRQATGNKAWKASWVRRIVDMVASFRTQWDADRARYLSKIFLKEWDTPLPKSKGVCFRDVYLDNQWKVVPKDPSHDCYMKVDYPFYAQSLLSEETELDLEDFRQRLRLFLQSLYYNNEAVFEVKLAFLHCAFRKVCTSKMLFEIGHGGDGKGMEAYLERSLLGESESATLDCGVFLDRSEFRKSGEFAWNKANVRIQEMDHQQRFVADLWKRFIVDEDIDCRVNYGFTSKRRFGSSMKVQELNYENIPTIEEGKDRRKGCEQLKRRIVCLRMGKCTFVTNADDVNHDKGVYLLIPQDELVSFLKHPLTASLYFKEWCLPFFLENSMEECLMRIHDLKSIHHHLAEDTEWLASRLSGNNVPPPGTETACLDQNAALVKLVHEKTPMKHLIREYLINKVEDLPGSIASTRGRTTKVQNFIESLDASGCPLFRQVEHKNFEKLIIDWRKMEGLMQTHGGISSFGSWQDWGCTFDLRTLQQPWGDHIFEDLLEKEAGHMLHHGDLSHLRPVVVTLQERIDIKALRAYAGSRSDRRQQQLDSYLARHDQHGTPDGDFSTLAVEYYQAANYGRLLARGPAGQKLTREARGVAFSASAELDAPCCHPRLLRRKLQSLELWTPSSFPMLDLFCEKYADWRQVLALYLEVPLEKAKTELIRIFYGGSPSCDIPWLRKLGAEVQQAAGLILSHPSSAQWKNTYSRRPNPEFSRLCAVLSFAENELMDLIKQDSNLKMEVAIFDGAIVRCDTLADDIAIKEACSLAKSNVVPLEVKRWSSQNQTFLRSLFQQGHVQLVPAPNMQNRYGHCTLDSLEALHVACNLQDLPHDRPLSAHDFNQWMLEGNGQEMELLQQLVHTDPCSLAHCHVGASFLCHEMLPCGQGHWWCLQWASPDVIQAFDPSMEQLAFHISPGLWPHLLQDANSVTLFEMKMVHIKTEALSGTVYTLPGAAHGQLAIRDPELRRT